MKKSNLALAKYSNSFIIIFLSVSLLLTTIIDYLDNELEDYY